MKKKILILGLYLFNTGLFWGQSVSKTILLLPDTGQTQSYTTTFGEDQDYLINPPSYTNNGNGTITDNITGLMWQQMDGGEMTIENAITYCDNLVLGGYSDWRLPTPIESFSILNHQNNNPATNTTYFTTTAAEYWWTSVFEFNSTTKVWCTNSGGGIGNHPKSETISAGGSKKFHARAVRNANTPTTIANHFTDNGDGTITDNLTQLIWQKTPNTTALTWEQAIAYAEGLSMAGASDWRLPNIKELQSLNNELATNPSVFSPYFGSLGIKWYWSSTSLPNQSTYAWYWSTTFGITTYSVKTSANYVICVKGSPTLDVKKETRGSSIKVYPNPASNYILISFPDKNTLSKIELSTILGQTISSKEINTTSNEYRLDTENFADGFYLLSVTSEDKKDTFKILINKK